VPTRGDARDQHTRPGRQTGDPGTDRLDDADAFVAEDAAAGAGGDVPLQDVQVGAADGGAHDADHGVGGLRELRHRPVLQALAADTLVDKSLHQRAPVVFARWPPRPLWWMFMHSA
jgi:hypothetical protein